VISGNAALVLQLDASILGQLFLPPRLIVKFSIVLGRYMGLTSAVP
jgi:hypothetical protein